MMWFEVFRKEISELFRDKRVTFGAFVMPALTVFMMFQLIGTIEKSVRKQQGSPITFVAGGEDSAIAKVFKDNKIRTVATLEEGRALVEKGESQLVLSLTPTFENDLATGQATLKAVYNSTEPLSQVMVRTVEEQIRQAYAKVAEQRLKDRGVDPKLATPVVVERIDVAKEEAKKGEALASFLPYLILLWAFYGGMSAVGDMVAGEKERGTMETLLVSPIKRHEVALGKFAALFLICVASSLCALIGVVLGVSVFKSTSAFGDGSLALPLSSIGAMMVTLLPLVGFFAAMLLLVSTWARNMREAQTYLAVVSFIVLIPTVLSNVIGFTGLARAAYIGYVPVLSSAVVLRGALLGDPNWTVAIQSLAVNALLAALLLHTAVQMFRQERILVRV